MFRSFVVLIFAIASATFSAADSTSEPSPRWTKSARGGVSQWFEFNGTGGRNNPLRRELETALEGEDLFVRFQLRYDAASLDSPADGNGEFFVLWFDELDGGDTAPHSNNVPNIGVHVSGQHNQFMARFSSSSQHFADTRLQGDRVYTVVARLARGDGQSAYGELSVWIDPSVTDLDQPQIAIHSEKSIRAVRWIGFATGGKTEPSDRIAVSEIDVASDWLGIHGLTFDEVAPQESDSNVSVAKPVTVDFASQVAPILEEHCFDCHSGESPESGVRLDSYDELLNQVTPHAASKSHLLALIESNDPQQRMPPAGGSELSREEIDRLRTWIDEGVRWDHRLLPTPASETTHWSFQPIRNVSVPRVESDLQIRTPVDAFLAKRQREIGVHPAGRADWKTLQRRVALDLTGLPPGEFPGIEHANDDAALDDWIDSLLRSQAYGERWGRFWLDLARWAESNGHQHNRPRPHAWRYRDYVIESFRDGKPYDQFVKEQLAGDLIERDSKPLAATGFLAAARYSGNELDKEIQRNDILVDVVNTTTKSLMGITLECAQCHTHKFDPLTIRDYYRMQAFFTNGQPGNLLVSEATRQSKSWIELRWQLFDSVYHRLVAQKRQAGVPEPVLVTPKLVVAGMTADERRVFDDLEAKIEPAAQAWGWAEAGSGVTVAPHEMRWPLPRHRGKERRLETYLRLRGDVKSRGPAVQPGWPNVFGATPQTANTRSDLAEWLTAPDHPLTARVWVNRIWQWHFGVGLVATSDDFGTQGVPPTHPELLDWLAGQLIDSGWDTNRIHRLIMRSEAYRRSSDVVAASQQADPDSTTLWRWTPRRLEAEAIRDSVLSAAGKLDRSFGGPSVDESSPRRSLYLQQQRDRFPESLTLFDAPAGLVACSKRRVSTVALQPLYLLNSEFMQQMSARLAERVRAETKSEDSARALIRITLARDATDREIERINEYLQHDSLESLCLVMLNLNEFLYLN